MYNKSQVCVSIPPVSSATRKTKINWKHWKDITKTLLLVKSGRVLELNSFVRDKHLYSPPTVSPPLKQKLMSECPWLLSLHIKSLFHEKPCISVPSNTLILRLSSALLSDSVTITNHSPHDCYWTKCNSHVSNFLQPLKALKCFQETNLLVMH